MNLEIGTDIIAISRIKNAIAKFGMSFLERFLLPNEILLAYKNRDSLSVLCRKDSKASNHLDMENQEFLTHDVVSCKFHFFTQENLELYSMQTQSTMMYLKHNFTLDSYKIDTIAGFWAIKEACSKALGVGIGKDIGFHDMCIYKDLHGKPHLALHESKYNAFKTQKIAISMSHDLENAIAICAITFADT
ncbi:holo-ACP synthase [Helicobacter trogontum]|uniref:holo-ACP synthase n=1 Tax=Helicobacter trogontum TaxID=50960 RepID=UPI000CF016CB|nr:holo-ACP synthase [Helicobacter trogontum]